MIAGTTGLEGSARGRMTVLAAVMGLALGWAMTSIFDGSPVVVGAVFSLLAAAATCAVTSGVIAGAHKRGGTAALVVILVLLALVVLALTLLLPYLALLPAAGLGWLGVTRRQKAARKHAGLRILR